MTTKRSEKMQQIFIHKIMQNSIKQTVGSDKIIVSKRTVYFKYVPKVNKRQAKKNEII